MLIKKRAATIGLFIIISGIAIFLIGCPPPIVRVRPPEPRVEVYGPPPHSEAAWIPGYWQHRRGLDLDPRPLGEAAEATRRLGAWPLGGEKGWLGLA